MRGGVLVLSAILALSLMFASCANSSDSNSDNNGGNNTVITDNNDNYNNNSNSGDNNSNNSNSNGNNGGNSSSNNGGGSSNDNDGNSSSDLPAEVGKNPITETVKLNLVYNEFYLELNPDGTAFYVNTHSNEEKTEAEFKYTYDEDKKEIYMKMEKYCAGDFEEKDLLTYDELRSKINEYFSVENIEQKFKAEYEELQDDESFKEEYPDGISYEDWEKEAIDWMGFKTLDDYVKYFRQMYEGLYKATFGAQITYAYEIKDGKITLTETFTGVKNLLISECRFSEGTDYLGISCYAAYLHFGDDDGDSIAYLSTDDKTINFSAKNINATYIENIAQEMVTISFNGEEYVCKFYGRIFTQE